jgi:hypothetical protein
MEHVPPKPVSAAAVGANCLADTRVNSRLRVALLLLAVAVPLGVAAQRTEPMTAARVRSLTRDARTAARGDKTEIMLGLDARIRERWGDFESFPIALVRREDLSVVVSAPYMTYRRTLADYLRIDRPIADIPWIPAVVVTVTPARVDAPDIMEVVVERGGRLIAPIESRLGPMTFSNGLGEQAVIRGGEVRFDMSAFAPGATVSISAIPRTGAAFVATLDDTQLLTLK